MASASIDGARQAAVTMDWLRQNGYQDLLGRACVVINHVTPGKTNIDVDDLVQQFERHVPAGRVVVLPWDKHIAAGSDIQFDLLSKTYQRRITELELVPHPANVQHPDTIEAEPVEAKVRRAIKSGQFKPGLLVGGGVDGLYDLALAAGIISRDEFGLVVRRGELRDKVIRVDDFPYDFDLRAALVDVVEPRKAA